MLSVSKRYAKKDIRYINILYILSIYLFLVFVSGCMYICYIFKQQLSSQCKIDYLILESIR